MSNFYREKRTEMGSKKRTLETLEQVKTFFEKLKTDVTSVIFIEEKINNRLLKKLKRSTYLEDKKLADLISAAENFDSVNKNNSKTFPTRLHYVEKREIDRSTLYNVPFN